MKHLGSCHCGNLSIELETALAPEELPVRACQCTFCRRHASLSTSDPAGHATIKVAEPAETSRYQFGLRAAEFLLCRRCGVYVAAVQRGEDGTLAVLNLNAFEERARFTQPPQPMDYDGEDLATRVARRKQRWTPATLIGLALALFLAAAGCSASPDPRCEAAAECGPSFPCPAGYECRPGTVCNLCVKIAADAGPSEAG